MHQNQPVPRVEVFTSSLHKVIEDPLAVGISWSPEKIGGSTEIVRFTKDQTGRISDDVYEVIEAVLNVHVPSPCNPAVLLKAALKWYLAHGGRGPVLSCIIEQLCEVEGLIVSDFDLDFFKKARKEFLEATHVKQPA